MPRKLAFWILLAILSAILVSCSLLPTAETSESIEYLPLAQPIGPPRRIVQQVKATWPNRQENLICVLELDKHHIAIAGLSTDGVSLFNLNYDGKTIKIDKSPLLPDNFSPEHIIKDLQLVYWPLTELKKILPHAWRLETGSNYRQLFSNNQQLAAIDYFQPEATWPKTVNLTNHRYHYQLSITTISYEALSE